ncbi:hypothetical protein DENSPDRAFT_884093 [Dentipellis sp. KUC8613]|nr:hypothetical protein DENSPDRAFT_884093 [Dentipellis sp. KUC8613]
MPPSAVSAPEPNIDSPNIPTFAVPPTIGDIEQMNGLPNIHPVMVPQTVPTAPGTSTRFSLKGPANSISFWNLHGTGEGVPLSDMRIKKFSGLAGPDDVVLERHGCQIMLHVNWPGYKEWRSPLRTRNQKCKTSVAATRGTLAHRVALRMQRFIEDQKNEPQPEEWVVGEGGIELDNLLLLRLVQITQGAWRAEFAVM